MEEGVVDLHFLAGTGVLQAFDDNAVAGLEATGDDPAIVLHRAQLHRLQGDAHLLVNRQHLSDTGAVTLHGALRHGQAVGNRRLLQAHTDEATGEQIEIRVREFAAQDDLAGARVDGDIGKQQLARQRIKAAVILNQRGFDLILTDLLQLPGAERTAQFIEFTGRLSDVGVNRIELLNQRQWRGFVLPDQGAFSHQRPTNTPGNRRSDGGVTQAEFRPLDRSLVGGNVSGSLSGRGAGVVVVLSADGLVADQLRVTLLLQFRLKRIGLGFAQCGFGAVEVSFERCRVDAEQHLTFFTSLPSRKVRSSTTPATRARTSAMRGAAMRPLSSLLSVKGRASRVSMRTVAGGACSSAFEDESHALSVSANAIRPSPASSLFDMYYPQY